MSDSELDRNQAATPYKLERARERGQVPKSNDVASALVFAAAVAFLCARGWTDMTNLVGFERRLLQTALSNTKDASTLWRDVEACVNSALLMLAPLLATVALAAIVGNIAQVGLRITFHPLQPDPQRINPVSGLKRLFSMRMLFDSLRACIKLVVLVCVAYAAIEALLPHLRFIAALPMPAILRSLVEDAISLVVKLASAMAVIAALDLAYTRREFAKKMRMSRRELKDEAKHREGDPRIRVRMRELRRHLLQRSISLRNVRNADVVLTNPTHVAVALKYRHGEMDAPVVIAKGKGALAAAVRKIAARHGVPVIQNPTLARTLYAQTQIDQAIPATQYAQVARIMVWVMSMRQAMHESRQRVSGAAA